MSDIGNMRVHKSICHRVYKCPISGDGTVGATCCHEALLLGALQHIDDCIEQVGLPLARVETLRSMQGCMPCLAFMAKP